MIKENLGSWAKIAIALGFVAGLSFLILAVVIFIQEGDWPARYISTGVTIWSVTFIAIMRLTSRRRG